MACGDIIATAYAGGVLALGWRTAASLRLTPAPSQRVTLGVDDQIVAIA